MLKQQRDAGGAFHPEPLPCGGKRKVDEPLVERLEAGSVRPRHANELALDVAGRGLRRQDHAGSRAQTQPHRHRLADEGVEAVAGLQVATVHHMFPEPGEFNFGVRVHAHDPRRHRPVG